MNPENSYPLTLSEIEELEVRLARLLGAGLPPVLIPGEAVLGIEAMALGVGKPGVQVLNVVTGPYGQAFGKALRAGGAEVVDLTVPFNQVATVDAVTEALAVGTYHVLAIVQVESATGGRNPLPEIAAVAKRFGTLVVVDAVSAFGAEPVEVDAWGLDLVAIGAQKALAGPNGISAVAVSAAAWDFLEARRSAVDDTSFLSLLGARQRRANASGQTVLGNTLPWLESRALAQALWDAEIAGLQVLQREHRQAARALAASLASLRLEAWQVSPAARAALATAIKIPQPAPAGWQIRLAACSPLLGPGIGVLEEQLVRVNHYGVHASLRAVLDALDQLQAVFALDVQDLLAAKAQAIDAWNESG